MAYQGSVTAIRGSKATNPAIQIIPNVSDRIFQKGAAELGFLRLLPKLKKRSVTDVKFDMLTDARLPYTATTNGGTLTSGTTTLTMADTTHMRPWEVWENELTKEHVFILTQPTSTTVTCVRGYGTTAAAAITDGQRWRNLGVAMSDGSVAPESRQTIVGSFTNYCQWFSTRVALTEQHDATGLYGMDEYQRQSKMTMFDFKRKIANAFYFGEPLLDVDNDSPKDSSLVNSRTTTGGLEYNIGIEDASSGTIILDAGGVLTQDLLWSFIEQVNLNDPEWMADGELGKILFSSSKVVKAFTKWKLPTIQTSVAEKTFGSNVTSYQSPFGKISVVYDLLLEGTEYGDYAFLINPKYLEYVYLNGKDMRVKTNIQDPDSHTREDEIYGCIGLGFNGPRGAHGMIKNAALAG